jgi:hypothetical protein
MGGGNGSKAPLFAPKLEGHLASLSSRDDDVAYQLRAEHVEPGTSDCKP